MYSNVKVIGIYRLSLIRHDDDSLRVRVASSQTGDLHGLVYRNEVHTRDHDRIPSHIVEAAKKMIQEATG